NRFARGGSSSTVVTGRPLDARCSVISPCPPPISIQQHSCGSATAEKLDVFRETPISRAICSRQFSSLKKCWPSLCRAMGRKVYQEALSCFAASDRENRAAIICAFSRGEVRVLFNVRCGLGIFGESKTPSACSLRNNSSETSFL